MLHKEHLNQKSALAYLREQQHKWHREALPRIREMKFAELGWADAEQVRLHEAAVSIYETHGAAGPITKDQAIQHAMHAAGAAIQADPDGIEAAAMRDRRDRLRAAGFDDKEITHWAMGLLLGLKAPKEQS